LFINLLFKVYFRIIIKIRYQKLYC